MKIVAAIHPRVAPINARLVFVVARAVLGQNAFAIGCNERMQIRPKIGFGVLSQDGCFVIKPKNRNGTCFFVLHQT